MSTPTFWRFGGGPDDYARHPDELELLPGIPLRVVDPDTGDEITDLRDSTGTPVSEVASGEDGTFDFYARRTAVDVGVPDGVGERLWRVLSKDAVRAGIGITTGAASGLRTTVPGLTEGTDDDNGPRIQAVLNGIKETANYDHSVQVDVEGPYGAPVYVNSPINIESDRVTLNWLSSVDAGPLFQVRIQGLVAELPESGKPTLEVDYEAGGLDLVVNDASLFGAGDYIVVRGARGATGDPVEGQKLYAYVASVNLGTNTITLTEGLEEDFLALNANPDSPPGTSPESQVTKVVAGNMTVDAARGARTVTVHDTSPFQAGDTVQVMDDSRTTRSTTGLPERDNFLSRNMNTVAEVVNGTTLRLEHALHHPVAVAELGKVILVHPVRGSKVRNARVRWVEMSEVQSAFEMRYTVSCRFLDCEVTGTGTGTAGRATKSWLGQAFRIADSLYGATVRCRASRPAASAGGQGYGFTIYGSNQCRIIDCWGSGLRHTTLLFNSAAGNLITGSVGENTLLSDWDLHGCGCADNTFTQLVSIGGDSLASNGDSNRAAIRVGNTAHQDGDHHNIFDGVTVFGFHDGAAIDLVASSHHNEIRGVTAIQCLTGVRARPTTGAIATLLTESNIVSGLTCRDVTNLLDVNGGGSAIVRKLLLEGVKVVGMTTNIRPQNAQNVEFRRLDLVDPALSSSTFAIYATGVSGLVVRQSDLSKSGKGVKLDTCPNSRITSTVMHDLLSTVVVDDAGGNTGTVFQRNDFAGFTATAAGSGASFTPDLT
jgi:hypothetical protein